MTARAAKAADGADVVAAINAGIDSYERSTGTTIMRGVRVELVAHIQAAVRRAVLKQFAPAPVATRHYWQETN